jgi:hypothetical protein
MCWVFTHLTTKIPFVYTNPPDFYHQNSLFFCFSDFWTFFFPVTCHRVCVVASAATLHHRVPLLATQLRDKHSTPLLFTCLLRQHVHGRSALYELSGTILVPRIFTRHSYFLLPLVRDLYRSLSCLRI